MFHELFKNIPEIPECMKIFSFTMHPRFMTYSILEVSHRCPRDWSFKLLLANIHDHVFELERLKAETANTKHGFMGLQSISLIKCLHREPN